MTDRNKFEEMLERLINEDKEGAEELFHEIVVEQSRKIYENLLESDLEDDEEVDEAKDEDDEEEIDEAKDEDDEEEEMDEGFDLEEFEVEADDDMMGGDETDDLEMDVSMDADDEMDMDMDMDDEGEDDVEDRVEDLEDALDELKAEFEKMMSDEDGDMDDEEGDMDGDMDDEEGDTDDEEQESYAFEEDDEEVEEQDELDLMREYVEKVGAPSNTEQGGTNTKSTIDDMKNDMGGTAQNIARNDTENGVEANKGELKGNGVFKGKPTEDNMGNVNVPGGKASKSMKNMPKGHGAEKKGAGETAANKKSTIGS